MSTQITKNIIVKADVSQAYTTWSNFENFPRFMKYIKSVSTVGGKSHWVVEGPLGKDVEWTAEVTRQDLNKRIGWNTKDNNGDVTTSGQVTFNELPQGQTEVTVMMQVDPKAGVVGDLVAALFANPEKRVEEDLQNFKNYVEGRLDRIG